MLADLALFLWNTVCRMAMLSVCAYVYAVLAWKSTLLGILFFPFIVHMIVMLYTDQEQETKDTYYDLRSAIRKRRFNNQPRNSRHGT